MLSKILNLPTPVQTPRWLQLEFRLQMRSQEARCFADHGSLAAKCWIFPKEPVEMIVERYFMHACLLLEFVQWRKISLEVQLSFLFLSQSFFHFFIANKLKGCLCPGGGVRIHALAIKAHNPALQCQQERSNSFIHKIFFFLMKRKYIVFASSLPLPLLCRCPLPPCRAEGWGRILRTLEGRAGRVTWTFYAQDVTVLTELKSKSPLCYCLTYLQLCQLGRHPSFMVLPYSHVKYHQDFLHYLTGYNYCRGELGPTHLNIILCSYFFSSISARLIYV